MSERLRKPIRLSDLRINALAFVTDNGAGNFPAGYALLHDWLTDDPAARADGTVFWLDQARGINRNDSLSSSFIRRHTRNGLDLGAVPMAERRSMQMLSDTIARKVIGDILRSRIVPPLASILDKDIRVALEEGGVRLGGWGGSFYYYDMPFKPDGKDIAQRPGLTQSPNDSFYRKPDGRYHTVGDEIEARGDRELLLRTSSLTIRDMVLAGELRMRDAPELLRTSWNAGMPASMKVDVTLRASVMVAEHLRDQADEGVRQIPDELLRLLEQQRRRLYERPGELLEDLLQRTLPDIPRVSAQPFADPEPAWAALAAQLDDALARSRARVHTHDAFVAPAVRPPEQAAPPSGPFDDPYLNSAYAALLANDSEALDRIAIAFSRSPEGQRLAQLGDQWLAEQQALEQQQREQQQREQSHAQLRQGPVM